MNITDTNDNEYYQSIKLEICILQEEVKIPKPFANTIGKFYIPVLMPLVDPGNGAEETINEAPRINKSNGTIKPSTYKEKNYIEMIIPGYISAVFEEIIPKGTRFLMAKMGTYTKISNLQIIGVYNKDLEVK